MSISVEQLRRRIEELPEDPPSNNPRVWYRTQKEHWLGWLGEYHTPGAYGREVKPRDAKWAYNHIVNPCMLYWLVESSGVAPEVVAAAKVARDGQGAYAARSGAIRRVAPWALVAAALWTDGPPAAANGLVARVARRLGFS